MKRHTQIMLYHLLPVAFWLLAIGGSAVPIVIYFLSSASRVPIANYSWGFLVAALVLCCITIIRRIPRQTETVTQCFHLAILLGVASYWLPTVLFLTLPIIIYLYYRHLFNFRSFLAFVIGYALIAIWASIGILLGWLVNPWADFFSTEFAWGWIPVGAALIAWIASMVAQRALYVR